MASRSDRHPDAAVVPIPVSQVVAGIVAAEKERYGTIPPECGARAIARSKHRAIAALVLLAHLRPSEAGRLVGVDDRAKASNYYRAFSCLPSADRISWLMAVSVNRLV